MNQNIGKSLESRQFFCFSDFSIVLVPPMLSISNQLEAAYQGQDVNLECQTEAYPASINYWTTEKGDMIISGELSFLTPRNLHRNVFIVF